MTRFFISIMISSLFLLDGCAAPQKIERPSVSVPPSEVSVSMVPKEERLEELIKPLVEGKKEPKRIISFYFRDAEIKDVLLALSKETDYNIVFDPDISGKVTLDVKKVTLSEALDILAESLGLVLEFRERTIRVSKPKLQTRVFTLNYIQTTRKGTGKISAVTGVGAVGGATEARGGTTIETGDTADLWKEIEDGLKVFVSKEGNLIINKLGNIIAVTDYPANLKRIAAFLEKVEGSIQRQVLIQAKIVEVSLSDKYKLGLDWSAITKIGSIKGSLPTGKMLGQALIGQGTGIFQIGVTHEDFSVLLDAMSQQGLIDVLSSPRISTLNNQKALIKVGRDEVFFEPNYTVERDLITGTPKSVLTGVTPRTVTVGVVLDVTPQISPDGRITLSIRPSITELVRIDEFKIRGEVYGSAPVVDIRETDTVVTVHDGQTILIGGMMMNKKKETATKTPFLGDIPLFKHLFRKTDQEVQKTELVIMLSPTILMGKRTEEISKEELQRIEIERLMRRFHGPLK